MQSDNLLQTYQAESELQQLRIRLLQTLLGFIFFASVLITAALLASSSNFLSPTNGIAPVAALLSVVMFYVVSRQHLVNLIGNALLAYLLFVSVFLYNTTAEDNPAVLFILLSLTVLTSAFISLRLTYWLMQAVILSLALWAAATFSDNNALFDDRLMGFLFTMTFGLVPFTIGLIARYFATKLQKIAINSQQTANLLAASTSIGQKMSQMLELNELLNAAVEIIRDRFAFYHVSIFLLDEESRYAHLTASTGDIGERMLARKHRLPVDATSVIGRVSQAAEVIVARDTEGESGHAFNELLPDTRSELAVPILDNEGMIGALDVQSRRPDAFTPLEIQALQVIASQLATAIRNARLFEDKEHSIRENKRLFIESETSLREIQRLNRQLTRQAWNDYLKMERRIGGVTLSGEGFSNVAKWSDHMVDAGRRRRAITKENDGRRTIAIPIELRGEVIGAIEVETDASGDKDDTVDMIRAITQRLAVSLDNARLFEESQEATAQEQRVSEIVAQYQSANSVDDLLQITLEGLAETLGAEDGAIRLGILPQDRSLLSDTQSNGDGLA
jgi:GAF domain-containing protein